VQEAVLKYKGFKEKYPDTELHFIGPLQRNKAKQAAGLFDCVQSVDRESLALELAKLAEGAGPLAANPLQRGTSVLKDLGAGLPVLLEFRTGEDTKSGFTNLDDLCRAAELVIACPSLSVRGLMTIAPATGDEDILRPAFRRMVEMRREMERRYPGAWSCLSMGMSNDFEIAIEEGSTMVRIGTAIFGKEVN
jgi:pyridoxal phosphate enzyme (YggS family)